MTEKTYMINHIPIKQVWLKENIILIKDVQKWVDEKLLRTQWKKKVIYKPKFKSWVIQKLKGLKNLANYIKWKP
jgi:hypothetical protein